MASVAFHNMNQFRNMAMCGCSRAGTVMDGGQSRDFISVEDVVAVNLHFLDNPGTSGIFNCGTGRAQPFNDVAAAVVNTLRAERGEAGLSLAQLVELDLIRYIPFPDDLSRDAIRAIPRQMCRACVPPVSPRPCATCRRAWPSTCATGAPASRCRMPALPGRNKPPPCLVMPAVFSWEAGAFPARVFADVDVSVHRRAASCRRSP